MAIEQRASSSVLLGLAFPFKLRFLSAKQRQNPPAEWLLETEEVACGLASRVPGTGMLR